MSDIAHTVTPDGYSNLYGYGMPDLNKALGLNINQDDLQKLKESEYNNNVALNALNALEAWKAGYTGEGVRVGVIDGGEGLNTEAANHEFSDLTIRIDAVAARGAHGFRVAQYIVAENHLPISLGGNGEKSETGSEAQRDVTGVAFNAKLYFADPDLVDLDIHVRESHIFSWFVDQGVDVINWSGSLGYDNSWHQEALKLAHEKGIIVVMAAGNDGAGMDGFRRNDILNYVNDYDNMIVASALRPEDRNELYSFSNHAGSVEHNHFAVVEDYSHAYSPSGEYEKNVNGTSFAAPYLAGAVALIIQKLRDEGKYDFDGDYKQVIDILKESSALPNEGNNIEYINYEGVLGESIPSGSSEHNVYDILTFNANGNDIDWDSLNMEILNPNTEFEFSSIRFENTIVIYMEEIRFDDGINNTGDYVLVREKHSEFARDAIEIIVSVDEEYLDAYTIGYVINLLENNTENEILSLISNALNLRIVELIQKQYENLYEDSINENHIVNIIEFSGRTNSEFFWDVVRGDVMEKYVTDNRLGYIGQSGDLILYQEFDM